MSHFPCPCCGHLSLPQGPGDYELCPICFWEDDPAQLRDPQSADGANGVSLADAQSIYQRLGAMNTAFRAQVRRARPDEPVEEGWRLFNATLDWSPALDDDRWPINSEALYYWRPTYWNGDQHRLPAPPQAATNADRFAAHLIRELAELTPAWEELERRWGAVSPFALCEAAANLALDAYRDDNDELAIAIVTALVPALDEESDLYAPNCVAIAFLENEGWHEPAIQHAIDLWPAPIRDDLRDQQAHLQRHQAEMKEREEVWHDLCRTAAGHPLDIVIEQLRARDAIGSANHLDDPHLSLGRELTARVMTNRLWLYRHPVDSVSVAWRFRAVRRPRKTLAWLARPRWVG